MRPAVAVTAMATRGAGVFATRGAPRESWAAFGCSAETVFSATSFLWRRRREKGCRPAGMLVSLMPVIVFPTGDVGHKGEGHTLHTNLGSNMSTPTSAASETTARTRRVYSVAQSVSNVACTTAVHAAIRFKKGANPALFRMDINTAF